MTAVAPLGGRHSWEDGDQLDGTVAMIYEKEQARRQHMAALPDQFGWCLHPPRHARDQPTDRPTEPLPRVGELPLLDWLTAQPGVVVDLVPAIPAERCQWCLLPGHVTAVRVHGDPAPDDSHNPIQTTETCTRDMCVASAVRQALIEQNPNSRNKIRVEVALPMTEQRQDKVEKILAEELDPIDDNPVPRRGEGRDDRGTEGGAR